jgi:hypothetical protein
MAHAPIDGGSIAPIPAGARLESPAAGMEGWRRSARFAHKLFRFGVIGFLVDIALILASAVVVPLLARVRVPLALDRVLRALSVSAFAIPTAFFVVGAVWSVVALVRIARSGDAGRRRVAFGVAVFPLVAGLAFSLVGGFWTLWATVGFARGRQLRRRGKVLLPPLGESDAWTRIDMSIAVPEELRSQLAARWRENGRTEHASVAAFARLTLDLVALGAPAGLIEAANLDAKDEIRHADLCFSIARALDGRSESPGPFAGAQDVGGLPASRTLALAQLAVSSLIDGALHEGLSARVIARLARRCEEPAIRAALLELAADEGRHSAHGWEVVEWCLAQVGAPVAHALRGAVHAIPEHVDSDLPEGARRGAWEKYGIHGEALEAEEHAKARADLARRVCELTAEVVAA